MRLIIGVIFLFLSVQSFAGYDANLTGTVTRIFTYPSGLVLFQLSTQPSSHPTCNRTYFAIATDVSESPANRMFSKLLTLHTTQKTAYIGYDSQGDCGNGYIRAHNIGNG